MTEKEIRDELFSLRDTGYRDFQSKLIPTVDPATVIGVRTPALRKFAKQLYKEKSFDEFLSVLPHEYFDENQLHAFIISEIRDYDRCVEEINRFLPFIDNWATCDQLSPVVFKKHRHELLDEINKTGIGPGGLGGKTTALALNIETYATHIAGLPVAINMCCHVNRHMTKIL